MSDLSGPARVIVTFVTAKTLTVLSPPTLVQVQDEWLRLVR